MNIEKEKLKRALSYYQQARRGEANRIEQARLKVQRLKVQRAEQQSIRFRIEQARLKVQGAKQQRIIRFGLDIMDIMFALIVFVGIIAGIKDIGMIVLFYFAVGFGVRFLWVSILALIVTLGRINPLQKGGLAILCRITLAPLALLNVPFWVATVLVIVLVILRNGRK